MINYIKRVFKSEHNEDIQQTELPTSQSAQPSESRSSLSDLIKITKQAELDKQTSRAEIHEGLIKGGLNGEEAYKLINKFASSIEVLAMFG